MAMPKFAVLNADGTIKQVVESNNRRIVIAERFPNNEVVGYGTVSREFREAFEAQESEGSQT